MAGERLRFARDLHEVLGLSLSAISLKCELAYRLLADAPAKAQDEVGEVLRTSRKALADVRSVSRGYREMSLSDEANAAVPMLSAAGIDTTVRHRCGELPAAGGHRPRRRARRGPDEHAAAQQGRALRDHHRAPRRRRRPGARQRRRRAAAAPATSRRRAAALAALDERLRELGGTLTHGADGRGWFRLRAVVPLPAGRAARRTPRLRGPSAATRATGAGRPRGRGTPT